MQKEMTLVNGLMYFESELQVLDACRTNILTGEGFNSFVRSIESDDFKNLLFVCHEAYDALKQENGNHLSLIVCSELVRLIHFKETGKLLENEADFRGRLISFLYYFWFVLEIELLGRMGLIQITRDTDITFHDPEIAKSIRCTEKDEKFAKDPESHAFCHINRLFKLQFGEDQVFIKAAKCCEE